MSSHTSSEDDGVTPLEKTITKVWEDVLNVRGVTRRDNFFDLGGHSLLAIQVMARLQEEGVGDELPVKLLINWPTVGELARALEKA